MLYFLFFYINVSGVYPLWVQFQRHSLTSTFNKFSRYKMYELFNFI